MNLFARCCDGFISDQANRKSEASGDVVYRADAEALLASSLNFMDMLPKPVNTDIYPAPSEDTIAMSSNNPDLDLLCHKLKEEEKSRQLEGKICAINPIFENYAAG
mmetsp:Transcript_36717/g.53796  ORF Transcript_36717/g.53796 Transcript_36717/m.53796 type:complete len:106 (-) Transcript_36717:80-397(-)